MMETLRNNGNEKYARWILESLQNLINGIYLNDIIADGICTRKDLGKPTDAIIRKLEYKSDEAIKEHRRYPQAAAHKAAHSKEKPNIWEIQSKTALFRSKRYKTLAKLLRIRRALQQGGFVSACCDQLTSAMGKADVRNAIGQLVRLIKAQRVGIDMMDITVCGAIAPYNAILGGKLICMLLCSPEIVAMYRQRYDKQESVIASSMKGTAVVRIPHLVLLGTTSLYGVGSSQYNRVRIPCGRIGGLEDDHLLYKELGPSEGYGTYHFGDLTVRLGDILLARRKEGRRVNSIFGEGVNPRMRKLREVFDFVGLPSDTMLLHKNARIVYGVALARNFTEVLLGLAARPRYLIPQSSPHKRTQQIAGYWRERWLLGRIGFPGILEEVKKHALTYPVKHGAKVVLPQEGNEQKELLFAT